MTWFKANVLAQLKQDHRRAFPEGFSHPVHFIKDLYNLRLTQVEDTLEWHNGIIGSQLKRNPDEIRQLRRVEAATTQRNIQLQVGPRDLGRLTPSAPLPVTSMDELLSFLERCREICIATSLLPETKRLITGVYDGLLQDELGLAIQADEHRCRAKIAEIIHIIVQAERREQAHMLSPWDFDGDDFPPFYRCPNTGSLIASCLNINTTVLPSQIPPSLRPRQPADPNPPGNLSQGGPPGTGGRPGPNRAQPGGRTSGSGRGTPSAGTRSAHRPPNQAFHPKLKAFWDSVPETRRAEGMNSWLVAAGSNTNDCLRRLGLTTRSCGHHHMRGICQRARCDLEHTDQELQPQGVDAVCGLLRQGLNLTG